MFLSVAYTIFQVIFFTLILIKFRNLTDCQVMLPWLNCGENILLEIKNVKFKKESGTFFVTISRVIWNHINNPSSPAVQYEYTQIKAQRISPDSAPKVRLQLVLHDDTTITFHFNNPVSELQKAERERVKEMLVQLLHKSKKTNTKEEPTKKQISKELEMKQKILQGSEEMFIMYKTLVSGGIISAEDFWTIPRAEAMLLAEQSQLQPIGVTSAFMSEARPEVDGCNSIQFNLTPDIIQSIFHTYPMIKRRYHEIVPSKITEKEFWTSFFQSQYFHKNKASNNNSQKNDIFVELAQEDEETSLQKLLMGSPDPLLDTSEPNNFLTNEGYGVMQPSNTDAGSKPMLRKYNHHSFMICQNFVETDLNSKKSVELVKKEQLKEMTKQNDLVTSAGQYLVPLKLSTSQLINREAEAHIKSKEDTLKALEKTKSDLKNFTLHELHECINPHTAYEALMEITDNSSLSSSNSSPKPGSSAMEEIRLCYLNSSQILCHFWMCFPVTNSSLEEKVSRMAESLMKCKSIALQDTMNKLPSKDGKFLKHLNDQLDLALLTYEQWISKKGRR